MRRKASFLNTAASALFFVISSLVLFLPFLGVSAYFFLQCLLGKEQFPYLLERLAVRPKEKLRGVVIWVHGASMGESLAFYGLIEWMLKTYPSVSILLTTTSASSGSFWKRRIQETPLFSGRLIQQMLPFDFPFLIEKFVRFWQPKLLLMNESDLWPFMQWSLRKRSVPRLLFSGRLSEKSVKRWRLFPDLFRSLTRGIQVFVSDEKQASYFLDLGREKPLVLPALKWAGRFLTSVIFLDKKWSDLKSALTGHKRGAFVVCGGSTHAGEEEILCAALVRLKKFCAEKRTTVIPKLILAPRDLNRLSVVKQIIESYGLSFATISSKDAMIDALSDSESATVSLKAHPVFLLDHMGLLSAAYGVSHIAVLGGSFFPEHRGHNPIEAVFSSCFVMAGPFIKSQESVFQKVYSSQSKGAVSAENLSDALLQTLENPSLVADRARAAFRLAQKERKQSVQAYQTCIQAQIEPLTKK